MSENCRNNSNKYYNNSDNLLTSRRTEGGKNDFQQLDHDFDPVPFCPGKLTGASLKS